MKKNKQIPRLYTINDNTVLRIVPSLAEEIGLNESILLLQIDFLKSISNTEEKKGRPWTYQSIRKLRQDYFPFWSKNTIDRAITNLQKMRLIRCDNFNKMSYDKTRWISLNYGKISKLKSLQVVGIHKIDSTLSQNGTRKHQIGTTLSQNGTTIPETSSETSQKNISSTKVETESELLERELDKAIDYIFSKTNIKLKKDKWLKIWWYNAVKIDSLNTLKIMIKNFCESKINKELGKWDWITFFKVQAKRAGYANRQPLQLNAVYSEPDHGMSDEEYKEHVRIRDAI